MVPMKLSGEEKTMGDLVVFVCFNMAELCGQKMQWIMLIMTNKADAYDIYNVGKQSVHWLFVPNLEFIYVYTAPPLKT